MFSASVKIPLNKFISRLLSWLVAGVGVLAAGTSAVAASELQVRAEPAQAGKAVHLSSDDTTLTLDAAARGPYRIEVLPQLPDLERVRAEVTVESLERLASAGECEVGFVVEFERGEVWKWTCNARGKVIFDARKGDEDVQRSGWECELPVSLGLVKLGDAFFMEWDGRLQFYRRAEGLRIKRLSLVVENMTGAGCEVQLSDLSFETLGKLGEDRIELQRPFARKVFMNILGWMPPEKFPSTFARQFYDFPILPVQDGIVGQVNAMGSHGVDVALLDFLGAKRPSMIQPQFDMMDAWLAAIRQSDYPEMTFAPFWEYDSGGADPYHKSAGIGSDSLNEAETFVATIVEYSARRYADDDDLYRLQGHPVDFFYNSMIYNDPAFWEGVRGKLKDGLGAPPILSLGPGGLPMTLYAEFDPDRFHAFTDTSFDSIFVFNLWGPTADVFPAKIIGHYRDQEKAVQVIGTAVPGYWSVRHNHRTIVSPRFTGRLREVLAASLDAGVDGIHVTTWNDFWENTDFCPSFSFLDSRLEVLEAMAAPWKGESAREVSPVPRAILSYRKVACPGEPLDFELLLLPTVGVDGPVTAKVRVSDQDGRFLYATDLTLNAGDTLQALRLSDEEQELFRVPDIAPGALDITVTLTHAGDSSELHHLPQVAVLPRDYLDPDLLHYSVPLHRLTRSGDDPQLELNGEIGLFAPSDGVVAYALVSQAENAQFALMRNSHAARMMAPSELAGAGYWPGRPSEITLSETDYLNHVDAMSDQGRHAMVPEIQNWNKALSHYPVNVSGNNYYMGLVRYADGSVAYTPLVWARTEKPGVDLVGSYVFNEISQGEILDRSRFSRNIRVGQNADILKPVMLRPDFPILHWGPDSTPVGVPIDFIPPGAASMECVFRFERTGTEQPLVGQPGYSRQLDMRLTPAGEFVLSRQGEINAVELKTAPLEPGRTYQAVGVYTEGELQLYLDGKRVGSVPCRGVRTGEGTWIGGLGDARFQGEIIRLNVYSGALAADEIRAMHERLELCLLF